MNKEFYEKNLAAVFDISISTDVKQAGTGNEESVLSSP